jgi:HEAT repeat protein
VNVTPILLKALKSDTYAVRLEAVRALGAIYSNLSLKEERIVTKALLALTEDPDPEVRAAVLPLLGPKALKVLLKHLTDPDPSVRDASVSALGQGGEELLPVLVELLSSRHSVERRGAARALADMKDRAIIPLLEQARYENPQVRAAVSYALGRIDSCQCSQALTTLLADPKVEVRLAAARGIGDGGHILFAPLLIDHVYDLSPRVRAATVRSLGILGYQEILPELPSLFKDREWLVREAVVTALGRLEGQAHSEILVKGLADPIAAVRESSAHALKQLDLFEEVAQSLSGLNPEAQEVLSQQYGWLSAPETVPQLVCLLTEKVWSGRAKQLSNLLPRTLGKHGTLENPHTSIPKSATNEQRPLPELTELVTELVHTLKQSPVTQKPVIATVLGQILSQGVCPPGVLEVLSETLAELSLPWSTRLACARALGQDPSGQAMPALQKALAQQPEPQVRASILSSLGRLGIQASFECIRHTLADPEPVVQIAAIEALGWLGDARALEDLVIFVSLGLPEIQVAACRSIARIFSAPHQQTMIHE